MTAPLAELIALHRAGRLAQAEAGYRVLIAASGHADAMQLLASLLHQSGRPAEALQWLDKALPQLVQRDAAESNRAAILLALGRPDDAIAAANSVLARNPGHIGAKRNRQYALLALARSRTELSRQVDAYRRYAEAGGDDADAWLEYGNALQNTGAADLAVAVFDRARALAPEAPQVASAALIAAHFGIDADATALSVRARAAAELYARDVVARHPVPTQRGCFGFYSPRFGDGPIASLVLPVLGALKVVGIRIVLCSGCDHGADDAAAFRALADVWLDVGALDDDAFAGAVAAAGVGVLFDLCGHAPGNRLRAFASRLAPLQVSWGDWFCTTGLASMDLFIGDAITTPAIEDALYAERVIRPSRSRFAFALPEDAPAPMLVPPQRVCFVSCNRLSKLTDATLAVWARVLQRVPESTLLLRSGGLEQTSLQGDTVQRFAAHGIDATRLRCEGYGSYRDTLLRYRTATLALDPFPFNGCVTTCDALAMGVPVIALLGRSLVARQSAALLHAIGCDDWIAVNPDDYVERAVALADAQANLVARERLADRTELALFDVAAFTADLLGAIRSAQR